MLLENGAEIKDVQHRLGHKNIQSQAGLPQSGQCDASTLAFLNGNEMERFLLKNIAENKLSQIQEIVG